MQEFFKKNHLFFYDIFLTISTLLAGDICTRIGVCSFRNPHAISFSFLHLNRKNHLSISTFPIKLIHWDFNSEVVNRLFFDSLTHNQRPFIYVFLLKINSRKRVILVLSFPHKLLYRNFRTR